MGPGRQKDQEDSIPKAAIREWDVWGPCGCRKEAEELGGEMGQLAVLASLAPSGESGLAAALTRAAVIRGIGGHGAAPVCQPSQHTRARPQTLPHSVHHNGPKALLCWAPC